MKRTLLVLSSLLSMVVLMSFGGGGDGVHSTGGAPAGYAGDPSNGNKTCNTSGCHTGATVQTLSGVFTSNIPGTGYTPGTTYTITAGFIRPGHTKYGFEATPQNASGTKLGTLANITAATQLVGTGGKYVTHTSSGISGTGSKTWNFRWTAPATGLGPVTFYGTFNATNSNSSVSGDSIFKTTYVVTEAPAGVQDQYADNFSLTTFPNPAFDNLNVKFTLQEPASVKIELYDINGNKTVSLFSGSGLNGEINKTFDISSYPQGIYFLRLNTGGSHSLHKVIKL